MKRSAGLDFPPTGSYQQSFVVIPLDSYSFLGFHFVITKLKSLKNMRRARFPPYGFISAEFRYSFPRFVYFKKGSIFVITKLKISKRYAGLDSPRTASYQQSFAMIPRDPYSF